MDTRCVLQFCALGVFIQRLVRRGNCVECVSRAGGKLASAAGLGARGDRLHNWLIYVLSIHPDVSLSDQFSRQMDRSNFAADNCSALRWGSRGVTINNRDKRSSRLIEAPDVESHSRDQRIWLDNDELSATCDSHTTHISNYPNIAGFIEII